MKAFSIDGYWVDDETEFSDYIVVDIDDSLGDNHPSGLTDDDIFFYGLSEGEIKDAILTQIPFTGQFVITNYKEL